MDSGINLCIIYFILLIKYNFLLKKYLFDFKGKVRFTAIVMLSIIFIVLMYESPSIFYNKLCKKLCVTNVLSV